MNVPKIEAVDFGNNCRLGVCFLHLICFWFYVYLSLVLVLVIIGGFVYWFGCSLPFFSFFFFLFVCVFVCVCMFLCMTFSV